MQRAAALLLVLVSGLAWALPASEVFRRVSPAVLVVEVLDSYGETIGHGTGVVVEKDRMITNCHATVKGRSLVVVRDTARMRARIVREETSLDLCLLEVPTGDAAVVGLRPSEELSTGEQVYAIDASLGFDKTLSAGLISSIRHAPHTRLVQTTAPIPPGSSGGGLFDEAGLLIGVTTAYLEKGQGFNFAVPVDWILDTLESEDAVEGQAQLDERARQPEERGKKEIDALHGEQVLALEREQRSIESRDQETELWERSLAQPGTRNSTDGSATAPQPPDNNNDGADALSQALYAIADRIGPMALRANLEHRSAKYRLRLSPLSGLIFFARQLESSGDEELDKTIRRELYAAEPLPLPAAPELRETLKEIDITISTNNRIHVGLPGEVFPSATYALPPEGTTSPTPIDEGMLDHFALEIESRVGKLVQQRGEQAYPRTARDRKWEGTARVVVAFGANGRLKRVSVAETSGYAVLDQRAVELVQEVLPSVPLELHSHGFTVRLAIIFTLGTNSTNVADTPSK